MKNAPGRACERNALRARLFELLRGRSGGWYPEQAEILAELGRRRIGRICAVQRNALRKIPIFEKLRRREWNPADDAML